MFVIRITCLITSKVVVSCCCPRHKGRVWNHLVQHCVRKLPFRDHRFASNPPSNHSKVGFVYLPLNSGALALICAIAWPRPKHPERIGRKNRETNTGEDAQAGLTSNCAPIDLHANYHYDYPRERTSNYTAHKSFARYYLLLVLVFAHVPARFLRDPEAAIGRPTAELTLLQFPRCINFACNWRHVPGVMGAQTPAAVEYFSKVSVNKIWGEIKSSLRWWFGFFSPHTPDNYHH